MNNVYTYMNKILPNAINADAPSISFSAAQCKPS